MQTNNMKISRSEASSADDIRKSELFSMKQYQQLKSSILRVWCNTFDYANQNSNTSLDFPYLLIKKQTTELSEVYQRTYWNCPLAYNQVRRLRNIEVEFHQLEVAFNWLPDAPCNEHTREINRIFIAARTIFTEFKEDRSHDCQSRLPMFASHIEKLIKELSMALNNILQNSTHYSS